MASYRFCRSDDLSLLVQAYDVCFRPHFPGLPALEVGDLKRASREIDLWTSSCMVALEGAEPVAMMLATKRGEETLIWRLGAHPAHMRRGHCRHLLTSLGSKLALLGPPRRLAEVPEERAAACALLESCGWRREVSYTDFVLRSPTPVQAASDLVIPITLDELIANDAFDRTARRAWERSPATLEKRKESIRGLAVASGERIEAWVLYEDAATPVERRLLGLGCAEESRIGTWLGLLVRELAASSPGPLRYPRVGPEELSADLLLSWGFSRAEVTAGYSTHARRA